MAVIVLYSGAGVLLLDVVLTRLPNQRWWPGWAVVGGWLGRWWPLLVAIVLAATAGAFLRLGARRPTATTSTSIRWESEPGRPGLLPRTTVTPGPPPVRRWNWTAVTSIVTAATALAALVFTAQSLSATREQITLSEQGQITDRYTKAIDQLGTQGPDHLQTRLGGIYALERLAGDSPRDQPTIVEILSAFLRSTLPTAADHLNGATNCPATTILQVDMRAALSVLGRRNHAYDKRTTTDLHDVCLVGADLSGTQLEGANLDGADLTHANLFAAQLTGANLYGADLTGADLKVTFLDDAVLIAANLTRARLEGAFLAEANLTDANFDGANLTDAVYDNNTITRGATKNDASGAWW
ncbi:putative secreted protein [Amycolatopsis vancoresmycina DSM 44592]|uniref:Putative secreted protein n=1 Tax=Amycolatopsis vancoresmycina DSM 44592 TaxID=1292037 RepID=R1FXD9_9PSEU|nr:putative secreted protein [Amycolatopsis vancoresmycina DSM 44592]